MNKQVDSLLMDGWISFILRLKLAFIALALATLMNDQNPLLAFT